MERDFDSMMADVLNGIDDEAHVQIGSNWSQGRTTYGGLGAALALASITRGLDLQKRPLRSLHVGFAAPISVGATVRIEAETVRAGASVTMATARMSAENQTKTLIQAMFGGDRTAKSAAAQAPDDMPNRDHLALGPHLPGMPMFLKSLDIKWAGNGIPTSGIPDRRMQAFVKFKDPVSSPDLLRVVALADMPPPIIMAHYTKKINAASITWSLDFVRPAESVTGDWLYLDYSLEGAEAGYCQQSGKIYDESGQLIVLSRQTMAYFDPK